MTKKLIISLSVIGIITAIAVGGTIAYFSDTETSVGDTFTAGTLDISINDQSPWTETFIWEDLKPGDTKEINLAIKNEGSNPVKIWKIIKNVVTHENDITNPEQKWYDASNSGQPKNDLDASIVYEMYVDTNLVVEKEAGITLDKIKDSYVNLVKLDQPFNPSDGDGILYPGEIIVVNQKYHLKEDTGNWAQTDKITFDIEILSQQINASEPIKQISFMQNKYDAGFETDEIIGVLKYDSMALEFNYDFLGVGLNPAEEYCLIYTKDPWSAVKPLIDRGTPDSNGKLILSGLEDLGDLPHSNDDNYPYGAKIWLVRCDDYSGGHLVNWSPNGWLFDNWPGLINYKKGETENGTEIKTVYFDQLGGDINNQYGYQHDYSTAVDNNVYLVYETPSDEKLSGAIHATGLKPYATYQVKLFGKPTCEYGTEGDDELNEKIGYKGRWTCTDCVCSGAGCNRDDSDYLTYSDYKGDKTQCIAGYLVFDFFTADENGEIVLSDTDISSDTSYHVGRCAGGICGNSGDAYLAQLDSSHSSVWFCPADKVNGEIESGRGGCNGLTLEAGNYNLKIALTEESFHQSLGTWATVLIGDIDFEIE